MCQKAGQKVGVAPVQQRQRDPGREAGRSDQGKADKEPRQQDPGEMRHRSERESITGSRSGEPPAQTSKGSRCGRTGKRGHRSEGKRQQDPGADQKRPQTNGTEQRQGKGHTEQEKTTTGQGERHADPKRKNLHGVEHHREPIRGTTCTPIRYGRNRGSRIREN